MKKFDAVIINPHFEYTEECRNLAESLTKQYAYLITDTNHIDYSARAKWKNVKEYIYLGIGSFPTTKLTVVCAILIDINKVGGKINIVGNDNRITPMELPLEFLPGNDTDDLRWAMEIISKGLKTYAAARGKICYAHCDIDPDGIPTIFTVGRRNAEEYGRVKNVDGKHLLDLAGLGEHKAVLSEASGVGYFGVVKYAGPEWAVGSDSWFVTCDSKTDALKMIDYIEQPKVKRFIKTIKNANKKNGRRVWRLIPHHNENDKWG